MQTTKQECNQLRAEKAALETERNTLRTLAHTNDQQIAALERTSQEWHAHADAAEADNLVLEQRVRELSADLEFANLKTRRKKLRRQRRKMFERSGCLIPMRFAAAVCVSLLALMSR